MDVKSTGSAASTSRTAQSPEVKMKELQQNMQDLQRKLNEGPGGIFKKVEDFINGLGIPSRDEIMKNMTKG